MTNEQKYTRSIAESLHGIHKELIKLNQTHPANQAEGKVKVEKKITELDPSKFMQLLLIEWWLFFMSETC